MEVLMAYPIDGFARTGIRRLLRVQKMELDAPGKSGLPTGALLISDSIRLSLLDHNVQDFPETDAAFQKKINSLFPNLDDSYSIAIIDITNIEDIRYAERKGSRAYQPGSVGKLAILTAMFCELENLYPYDFDKRIELLKNKQVKAGKWALPNIHPVPIYNPEKNTFEKRLLVESDVFSLFEWLDHMVSVSSNGAASVVWRELLLMNQLGLDYPELSSEGSIEFFKNADKRMLSRLAVDLVNEPLREIGISDNEFRLGSFFTRGATNQITPYGGSQATVTGLIKWLYTLEHGQIIDTESSLEIKKLMYLTDRRIRFASNSSLKSAAVYFKSGSLYKCRQEENYVCEKYKGNVDNFMNSVAIVEHTDGRKYMVALMSNVLRKNSNIDHNLLAGSIDKIVKESNI